MSHSKHKVQSLNLFLVLNQLVQFVNFFISGNQFQKFRRQVQGASEYFTLIQQT